MHAPYCWKENPQINPLSFCFRLQQITRPAQEEKSEDKNEEDKSEKLEKKEDEEKKDEEEKDEKEESRWLVKIVHLSLCQFRQEGIATYH